MALVLDEAKRGERRGRGGKTRRKTWGGRFEGRGMENRQECLCHDLEFTAEVAKGRGAGTMRGRLGFLGFRRNGLRLSSCNRKGLP